MSREAPALRQRALRRHGPRSRSWWRERCQKSDDLVNRTPVEIPPPGPIVGCKILYRCAASSRPTGILAIIHITASPDQVSSIDFNPVPESLIFSKQINLSIKTIHAQNTA
jgi:hypothetical protein